MGSRIAHATVELNDAVAAALNVPRTRIERKRCFDRTFS